MLKTLIRLTHARSALRQNFQATNNANSLLVHLRLLSTSDANIGTKFTRDDIENEQRITNNPDNPFAQSNTLSTSNSISNDAPFLSDEERAKLLKVLQLEVDIGRQEGKRVPNLSTITDENWSYILTLPTKSARYKFYSYLWQVEVKKDARERKKEERALKTIERKEELRKEREENQHIIYGLGHTSLFLRVYDTTMNNFQNNKLIRAMQFSPKVVLDCSYDKHMTRREALNAAKQLMLCFADNRAHDDPFDLHFCNVNVKSVCTKALQRFIPTMFNPEFPMNVHDKCFTELFDKDKLVYLTPHCRTDLQSYNHDDVYIIGAMVDKINNEPLSLAKAKRLGLRMARLPLDRYLQWNSGSGKSLTLNQMVNILLDLKTTKDWSKALEHVPRRKIVDMSTQILREKWFLDKRSKQLNFNLTDILNDKDRNEREYRKPKIRTNMKNAEFDLETWGTKTKNRNAN